MDVLESPLEALIFKYLGLGLLTTVNGICTWVAVLTAAVSFWRIRAVGSYSHPHKSDGSHSFHDQITDGSHSQPLGELKPLESLEEPAQACSSTSSVSTVEDDGMVKGKFTVCYFGDDDSNGDESTLKEGWSDDDVSGGYLERESWEGLVMRRGDLGWYRYQDLTVLNGSIVRLWDDVKRRNSQLGGVGW